MIVKDDRGHGLEGPGAEARLKQLRGRFRQASLRRERRSFAIVLGAQAGRWLVWTAGLTLFALILMAVADRIF